MGKFIGREIVIGIGREVERGTPVAASFFIPRKDFDFDDKATIIVDDQSYGVIEDSIGGKVVSRWGEGSLRGAVRDKSIGLLLAGAIGTAAAAVLEAGVDTAYTHTFTILQTHQHPSITLNIEDPVGGDLRYPLCMISRFEIAAELNEFVIFTTDLISRESVTGTVTAAYVAENEFLASDMEIKVADTAAEFDTATAVKVKSAVITIEKEVEKDDVLGAITPDDLLNKSFRVEVRIVKSYEGTTYKALYQSGTAKALKLEMENEGVTISTTKHPKLTIDLNKVTIMDWSKSTDLDNIITETIVFKANFKIADAKMIQAQLVNTHASYLW